MKKLFCYIVLLLALIIPPTAFAQSCKELLPATKDAMSGETTYEGFILQTDQTAGIRVTVSVSKKEVYLILRVATTNFRCIDKDEEVWFKFEDGTLLKTTNYNKFNCEKVYYFSLTGIIANQALAAALKTKKVVMIRTYGYGGYYNDFAITPEHQTKFSKILECAHAAAPGT